MTETTIKNRGELDHLEAANITQGFVWLKRKKNPQILTDSLKSRVRVNFFCLLAALFLVGLHAHSKGTQFPE